VELIVSIIALVAHPPEIVIVQASLIGSMLSNLLLVMGMCFFFGGLNRVEQHFNVTVAQTASSLLSLAVASLIIPSAFLAWAGGSGKFSSGPSRCRLPPTDLPNRLDKQQEHHCSFSGDFCSIVTRLWGLSDLPAEVAC